MFEASCELCWESFIYHTKKTLTKSLLRYVTINFKTKQTFTQVIQSKMYTVNNLLLKYFICNVLIFYACSTFFLFRKCTIKAIDANYM